MTTLTYHFLCDCGVNATSFADQPCIVMHACIRCGRWTWFEFGRAGDQLVVRRGPDFGELGIEYDAPPKNFRQALIRALHRPQRVFYVAES